jgi:hypothetical protein
MRVKTLFYCSMVTGMAWAKNPMLPRLKDLHAEGEKCNLETGTLRDGLVTVQNLENSRPVTVSASVGDTDPNVFGSA